MPVTVAPPATEDPSITLLRDLFDPDIAGAIRPTLPHLQPGDTLTIRNWDRLPKGYSYLIEREIPEVQPLSWSNFKSLSLQIPLKVPLKVSPRPGVNLPVWTHREIDQTIARWDSERPEYLMDLATGKAARISEVLLHPATRGLWESRERNYDLWSQTRRDFPPGALRDALLQRLSEEYVDLTTRILELLP